MPTYDYTCDSCGHKLEAFQSITAEPLNHCPNCNKPSLTRGVGGGLATFRFQGSGFYLTDYKCCHKGGCGCESGTAPKSGNEGN